MSTNVDSCGKSGPSHLSPDSIGEHTITMERHWAIIDRNSPDELARRYVNGESLTDLSNSTGLARETIRRRIIGVGGTIYSKGCRVGHVRTEEDRAGRALAFDRHSIPLDRARTWCAQCDRNVMTSEADACSSQWCKAKEFAA